MTQKVFEATDVELSKLFSNDYIFRLPPYQRPYAWTKEETGELLDDLLNAVGDGDKAEPYFLGSVVLIRPSSPSSSVHLVIDGQQRLTTLTILFCVLRELADDEKKKDYLDELVHESANAFTGRRDRFRIELREQDQDYFRDKIQIRHRLSDFVAEGNIQRSDSRKRIFENSSLLWCKLKKLSQQERDALSQFVIRNCYLVVVTASDADSAHRVFSVLNDRGLDLTPTDILKAEVIGEIAGKAQQRYTRRWEDFEDELGREQFRELFGHIFVIETGNRFHRELAKVFKKEVLSSHKGSAFIDGILTQYFDAFKAVAKEEYSGPKRSAEINRLLSYLRELDNTEWIAPAMVFFDRFKDAPDDLARLLHALDRLAYGMLLKGDTRDPRVLRYQSALAAAKSNRRNASAILANLRLTKDEEADIVNALDGPIYGSRPIARFVRPLLLRLNGALADPNVAYTNSTITVEHVLPQSPERDSEWVKNFPDEDVRADWTDRLANLVLLSRSKNSLAQNYDFERKKREYFQKGGIPPFPLTVQVIKAKNWTPRVLARRQKELIDTLSKEWGISSGKGSSR